VDETLGDHHLRPQVVVTERRHDAPDVQGRVGQRHRDGQPVVDIVDSAAPPALKASCDIG